MIRRREATFFKWMLLVITPIGMIIGLHEAWRLAGGMVVLVAAQLLILTLAAVALVRKVREEQRQ
jgi:hypothetical protein